MRAELLSLAHGFDFYWSYSRGTFNGLTIKDLNAKRVLTVSLLNQSIILPVLIIGIVTFAFSLLGLYLGKYFGKRLGKAVEIFGGLLLIGIGLKILIEHQYLSY